MLVLNGLLKPGGVDIDDIVRVRPSQQLFWKMRLGSFYAGDTFEPIEYRVISYSGSNPAILNLKSLGGKQQESANAKWFDADLEGIPEEDYASKSSSFSDLLNLNPRCKWCHEHIFRYNGLGEFYGHWAHVTTHHNPFGTSNKWACSTHMTIDHKWHIAEHPFLGTNNGTKKVITTKPLKFKSYQKPVFNTEPIYFTQDSNFGKTDSIISLHR